MNAPPTTENPLLANWATPDEVPPFRQIKPEHFTPAYDRAFAAHNAEIATIAASADPPDFENTIAALERSGKALARVDAVFHLLVGANSNEKLLEIEREVGTAGCQPLEQHPHQPGPVPPH